MSIDVTEVLRNENIQRPFETVLEIPSVEFDTGAFRVTEPIKVKGTIVMMDGRLFMRGGFDIVLERVCDRCGESYQRSYQLVIDEVFTQDDAEGSPDSYSFEGELLDIERMIEDCIVLQIPTASLCRENCKGLCPICGVDLNRAKCNCGAETLSSPFSVLTVLADLEKEE